MADKPAGVTTIAFLTPMTTARASGKGNASSVDHLVRPTTFTCCKTAGLLVQVFWRVMWPSFLNVSAAYLRDDQPWCSQYWYAFYVGFDAGDAVLDDMEVSGHSQNDLPFAGWL